MGKVLLTGSTGYVGGRLLPKLLEGGRAVRCLVRDARRFDRERWPDVEVVEGDLLDPATLPAALEGVSAAYYLVHSMAAGERGFAERDILAARNFGNAAKGAGLEKIIYLGGLGRRDGVLSEHLKSRQETGDVLRASGVPVTELRAGVVVGSGSISFELIRYLAERLPVMICPRWVSTRTQPIAIRDLLRYLLACLEEPRVQGEILEVGGRDVLTYGEMLLEYASIRGLQRRILNVPVLTPRLSSLWVDLVTPIPASFARPLIEGLKSEVVVFDHSARDIFPSIQPMSYGEAVRLALDRVGTNLVETTWSGSRSSAFDRAPDPVRVTSAEGLIIETWEKVVESSPEDAFGIAEGLGGERGWLYGNVLWRMRAVVDRLLGGVGMRRGRRHPDRLRPGDAVDFWRVEVVERNRRLLLGAEMRLPGRAWLEFEVQPREEGRSLFRMRAIFEPKGLSGFLYWYLLYPAHAPIFSGMAKAIKREAEKKSRQAAAPR